MGQSATGGPGRYQFFLRDLFLTTVCLALILAGLVKMPAAVWDEAVYLADFGVIFAVATALAYWAVFVARRFWVCVLAAVLFPPAALMVCCLWALHACGWVPGAAGQQDSPSSGQRHGRAYRCCVAGMALLTGALVVLPPAVVFFIVLRQICSGTIALPASTGWDVVTTAGQQLADLVPDYNVYSETVLRDFVTQYGRVLDEVRDSLDRDRQVRRSYRAEERSNTITPIKDLVFAFCAEERLAEIEKRMPDAANSCLDTIRLGQGIALGGSALDSMLGMASENCGVERLHGILAHLSPAECRRLAASLQAIQENREPIEEVMARDLAWNTHPLTWRGILTATVIRITGPAGPALNLYQWYERTRAEMGLLISELESSAGRVDGSATDVPAGAADVQSDLPEAHQEHSRE